MKYCYISHVIKIPHTLFYCQFQWPAFIFDFDLFYIPINSKTASTLLYWLKHWAAHVVASNVALLYMRSKFPLAVLGNTRLDRSTKRVCTGTPACIKQIFTAQTCHILMNIWTHMIAYLQSFFFFGKVLYLNFMDWKILNFMTLLWDLQEHWKVWKSGCASTNTVQNQPLEIKS